MPIPGEHKTVQARILAYAQEIGWAYVPRAEAGALRGFDPDGVTPEDRARPEKARCQLRIPKMGSIKPNSGMTNSV
jgi:hypothetical protein